MNRAELKNKAKEQLQGKRGVLALVTLIPFLLSLGIEFGSKLIESQAIIIIISLLMSLISIVLQYGTSKIYLDVANSREISVYDLFIGFTKKAGLKAIGLGLLMSIIAFIPMAIISAVCVIFIISSLDSAVLGIAIMVISFLTVSIMITLMYSQAFFILCEDDSKGVVECLSSSRKMMKGHKWEYFVLMLSFILWMLLVVVTCGIAVLYVTPYITTVYADFYLELKNDGKVDDTLNNF